MKKVAIIGAGMMVKPIADYLLDRCDYEVLLADQILSKARKIIAGRPRGRAVAVEVKHPRDLGNIIDEVDIVVSMLPRPLHIHVAKSCLQCKKSMLTASYQSPEVTALADEAKEKGILFLDELGEDPGIDHLGTRMLLDEIGQEGGNAVDVKSFGSGIPSFQHNNNPMGYKFSWAPQGLFAAAQTGAAYYIEGKRHEVPGDRLFKHFHFIDIHGLGTFETYPNRDCKKYLDIFGLADHVSFYRGLLRYPGYCNNMRYLHEIGFSHGEREENFENVTYRQLTARLVGAGEAGEVEKGVAEYLNLDIDADFIHRLRWLGFFDDRPVDIKKGTLLEVLLDRMLAKMSYAPHEKDMIIVHIEIIAEFPGKPNEKRTATMMVEGIPGGDSAMSRAVGLPIAIGTRMVLQGNIAAAGAHIPPAIPGLYRPVLDELATFGFVFKRKVSAAQPK